MSKIVPVAPRIVLASNSQRRRVLIRALDIPIELVSPDVEEGRPQPGEMPREFVLRLSLEKARYVSAWTPDAVVLGADTVVVWEGHVFGKPFDQTEALQMLRVLRGSVHTVITGVTVLDGRTKQYVTSTNSTEVTLRNFSNDEIDDYVASQEPLDKAGAYAIQDDVFRPASNILGCYFNVIGLPICDVVELLEQIWERPRISKGWHPPESCRHCTLIKRVEVDQA